MKKKLLIVFLLLAFTGCGNSTASPNMSSPAPESSDSADASDTAQALPFTFTAEDLDGNPVDQTVFANTKLTLMNVWATFCNPCLKEMPDLAALHAAGGTDYQVIGVCADLDGSEDMLQVANEVVTQTGANYLHLKPSESLMPVLTATSAVPVSFFFDSEGNLVGQGIVGALDKEGWEKEIQARLEMVSESETADTQNAAS